MTDFVLSPRAQADLDEIWDYTELRWSTTQAERYIRQLWQGLEYVASDPRRGDACDDIRAGYRKYAVGSHVNFFRMSGASVDVVRILHGRMDFNRHL